jgi:SOS-response transcriptional repressor LexA
VAKPEKSARERLAALRKKMGWGQETLAEKMGYSRTYIGMIERGEKEPGPRFLRDLEEFEAIARTSRIIEPTPSTSEHSLVLREDEPASIRGTGGLSARRIPVISMAQAGSLTSWEEIDDYEGVETFAVKDPRAIAVRIRGDSMSPDYKEGTIAILYPSTPPRSDNLVVAKLFNGSVLFKRLHIANGKYHFLSINPAYEPIVVSPDEVERMFPVGKTERDEL